MAAGLVWSLTVARRGSIWRNQTFSLLWIVVDLGKVIL